MEDGKKKMAKRKISAKLLLSWTNSMAPFALMLAVGMPNLLNLETEYLDEATWEKFVIDVDKICARAPYCASLPPVVVRLLEPIPVEPALRALPCTASRKIMATTARSARCGEVSSLRLSCTVLSNQVCLLPGPGASLIVRCDCA